VKEYYPVKWQRKAIIRLFAEMGERGWTCAPAHSTYDLSEMVLLDHKHPKDVIWVRLWRSMGEDRHPYQVYIYINLHDLDEYARQIRDGLPEQIHHAAMGLCRLEERETVCPCGQIVAITVYDGADSIPPDIPCPSCGHIVSHFWYDYQND
jgi:hypothetical protein